VRCREREQFARSKERENYFQERRNH
jgi:hypothetical protein